MTTATFSIIVIAVPVLAVIGAIGLARFSDRVSKGFPRQWRLTCFVVLSVVYLTQAGMAFFDGAVVRTISYGAAAVFWSVVLFATARPKLPASVS